MRFPTRGLANRGVEGPLEEQKTGKRQKEKKKQRDDGSIDRFLDDLESL